MNTFFDPIHPTVEQLAALHDGQLDPITAVSVREHADRCAICLEELGRLSAMSAMFSATPRSALSQMGRARVQKHIESLIGGQSDSALIRFGWRISGIAASVLLAGSIALAISGSQGTVNQVRQSVEAAPPWVGVAVSSDADAVVRNANSPAAAVYLADASSNEAN